MMENDIYPIRPNVIPLKVALAAWMIEGADTRPSREGCGKGSGATWHWCLCCPTSKTMVALARSGTSSIKIMDLPDPVLTRVLRVLW